jgi:hypothetical protein
MRLRERLFSVVKAVFYSIIENYNILFTGIIKISKVFLQLFCLVPLWFSKNSKGGPKEIYDQKCTLILIHPIV